MWFTVQHSRQNRALSNIHWSMCVDREYRSIHSIQETLKNAYWRHTHPLVCLLKLGAIYKSLLTTRPLGSVNFILWDSNQLFEACVWQRTMGGSCSKPAPSGLEAFIWANAASVSGNEGGVAGVFVGTQLCRRKRLLTSPLHTHTQATTLQSS